MSESIAPGSAPPSRIEIIDILRGFSLFGIILVHFTEQYYAGQAPASIGSIGQHSIADNIIQGIIFLLISGKFFMIFSFLFGLSFAIQINGKSNTFLIRYFWRIVLLFGIGFLHHVNYRGDILTIYAVLGVGMILLARVPKKILWILVWILVLDFPAVVTRSVEAIQAPVEQGPNRIPPPEEVAKAKADSINLETYYKTVKSGSYNEVLKANLDEFKFKMEFQVMSGRIYITFGLFLLGVLAGRARFFETFHEKIPTLRRLRKVAWFTLVGCIVAAVGLGALQNIVPQILWPIGGLIYDIFNAALAFIYIITLLILFQQDKWKSRLMHLNAVGRMGLTTYLTQTILGTALFFGWGFGLLNVLPVWATALIAIAIYFGQMKFSDWWLNKYHYGIFEWIWRCATYGRLFPLRKS